METLTEFNRRTAQEYGLADSGDPRPLGILCPVRCCGGELRDSEPFITLATIPPTKAVHCPRCGYQGHRIIDPEGVPGGALPRYEAGRTATDARVGLKGPRDADRA